MKEGLMLENVTNAELGEAIAFEWGSIAAFHADVANSFSNGLSVHDRQLVIECITRRMDW